MEKIEGQDQLITVLSKRAKFVKKDVKIILDELTNLLEELVFTDNGIFENGKAKILLRVRDFGILKIVPIPERLGNDGKLLPASSKIVFSLGERIRFANRREKDVSEDLDNECD